MLLPELRLAVADANRSIAASGLVLLSFGNASGIDRDAGLMVIKASGFACGTLEPEQTVVVSLDDGRVVDGRYRPSSDTPTHLVLYRRFPELGGVVHTHSRHATAWAQAGAAIPCLGTTHADYFHGPVPVTRSLRGEEIAGDYEANTGQVIVEAIQEACGSPDELPAVIVRSHGPFAWGRDAADAAEHAAALEIVAGMALDTVVIRAELPAIDPALLERHFWRKHGPGATYGQPASGTRNP